jgi:Na+/H+-dicarboxylate symporter
MKDSKGITQRILVSLAIGILCGILIHLLPSHASITPWLLKCLTLGGQGFIALLKLLVVPLVLVSLISGTACIESIQQVGSLGLKILLLYLGTTAMAISLALGAALWIQPGNGIQPASFLSKPSAETSDHDPQSAWMRSQIEKIAETQQLPLDPYPDPRSHTQTRTDPFATLLDLIPSNPFASLANGHLLQVIVFALLFGMAVQQAGAAGQAVRNLVENLNEVIMQLVGMVMQLAPIGVFCLVTHTFATQGIQAIQPLMRYFLVVAGVLMVHAFVVYPLLLRLLAALPALPFIRKMTSVQLFAFSTASSNATLPVSMETTTRRLGVSPSVAAFTLPIGATLNMDGTAIMQGVATVFISQAWGITLSAQDCLMVIATATLASIGTAGVPGVGLVMLSMVLIQVGLPVEGIAIIMGIDRLLDMTRTAVNVSGDCAMSCIVAKWEGKLDKSTYLKDCSTTN